MPPLPSATPSTSQLSPRFRHRIRRVKRAAIASDTCSQCNGNADESTFVSSCFPNHDDIA